MGKLPLQNRTTKQESMCECLSVLQEVWRSWTTDNSTGQWPLSLLNLEQMCPVTIQCTLLYVQNSFIFSVCVCLLVCLLDTLFGFSAVFGLCKLVSWGDRLKCGQISDVPKPQGPTSWSGGHVESMFWTVKLSKFGFGSSLISSSLLL